MTSHTFDNIRNFSIVAHIDHAVNVCGEDHVGIGTDGGTTAVDDMAAYRAAIRQEIASHHGEREDRVALDLLEKAGAVYRSAPGAGLEGASSLSRTLGATHVVVVGTYDLGRSPWATATGQASLLSEASTKFNTELLVSLVDLGANVLYVDAALLYNLMISNPEFYALSNAVDPDGLFTSDQSRRLGL